MTKCQLWKSFEQISKWLCRFLPMKLQYQRQWSFIMGDRAMFYLFFPSSVSFFLNRRFQSFICFLMLHKEQTTFLFQWIYTLKSLLTSKICHCFSLGSNEAEWKGRGATSGALWTPTVIFGKETESAPHTSFRKVLRFQRDNSLFKSSANTSDCYKRPLCCLENNEKYLHEWFKMESMK